MVAESWFRSLWGTKRKNAASSQKVVIGVLAFESASLMSKVVHLWQSLSDKNINRLREEIAESVGIKKLVSEDDEVIVRLICSEMIENMRNIARSVGRLGKKCTDPGLKSFEAFFENLMKIGVDPCGWKLTWKKMEGKIRKMERFVAVNANLYQEMEVLADLEQTLKRMKSNDGDPANLLEYQKKVVWKRHEVKTLQEMSLWSKNYDYVVRLLARSLFTVFARIKHVFGIQQLADVGDIKDPKALTSNHVSRSQPLSALLQSSVHPSENNHARFFSGALGRSTEKSVPVLKASNAKNFYSGPLGSSNMKASTASEIDNPKSVSFYSGPLGGSSTKASPASGMHNANSVSFRPGPPGKSTKSGPFISANKIRQGIWRGLGHSSVFQGRKSNSKQNQLASMGPLKGCVMNGNDSPITDCYVDKDGVPPRKHDSSVDSKLEDVNGYKVDSNLSSFSSKSRLLNAPPESLGAAGLALHYANVIIVIQKLAEAPHLIGLDARDDLYNMLPTSVRTNLKSKLKPCTKSLASLDYDTSLAGEWSEAISRILDWLAPLAHNMIRWQSERSFEQQNLVSRTNMLLVQTLYFANQEKTEAIITELLVGLNYIWRFGRELNAKALVECASSRIFDECLDLKE
ncbi:hypothetical protein BT93_B1635 [Corymbia citriodora subsp. variegata]|nr:hypothetical protein BT93_B1635 [Corymbia citriodora subsp. variegata]